MRFTERELTLAVQGAAKSVVTGRDRSVRRGRRTADEAWAALTGHERYRALDGVGGQVLRVLVALPDVEVPTGSRPTFTDDEVAEAIRSTAGPGVGGLRARVLLRANVVLVQLALSHVPPRADPDALIVPDHL